MSEFQSSDLSTPFEGIVAQQPPQTDAKSSKPKKDNQKITLPKEEENYEQKAKLIYAIQAYGRNPVFGAYLKSQNMKYDDSYLNRLNIEQLELELKKQDVILANRANNDMINTGIKSVMKVAEGVISRTNKFKINGTTDKCFDNDSWVFLLERCKMRYGVGSWASMDPVLELTLITFQTAMLCHAQNSFMSSVETTVNLDEPALNNTNN